MVNFVTSVILFRFIFGVLLVLYKSETLQISHKGSSSYKFDSCQVFKLKMKLNSNSQLQTQIKISSSSVWVYFHCFNINFSLHYFMMYLLSQAYLSSVLANWGLEFPDHALKAMIKRLITCIIIVTNNPYRNRP